MTEVEHSSRPRGRPGRPGLHTVPALPWALDGLPQALVRVVLDTSLLGIVACDAAGRLTVCNDVAAAWHPALLDLAIGPTDRAHTLYDPVSGAVLPSNRLPLARTLAEGSLRDVEVLIAPPGLPQRTVRCEGHRLHGQAGEVVGAVVLSTDVTGVRTVKDQLRTTGEALRQTAAALAISEERFRAAFLHGPMAMCAVDTAGVISRVNPALRRLLASPSYRLVGQPLATLVAPADRNRLAVALAGNGSTLLVADPIEVRLERPDGRRIWSELGTIQIANGAVHALVSFADVEGRKHREGHLQRLAGHDALTGLTSRPALALLLTDLLAPGEHDRELTLLHVAVAGDERADRDDVALEVADRLLHAVRPRDLVARVGRGEFVVLCQDLTGPATRGLVRRLHSALSVTLPLPGGAVAVTATIRATLAVPGDEPYALLARVDAAAGNRGMAGRADPHPADLHPAAPHPAGPHPAAPAPAPGHLRPTASRAGRTRLGELVDTAVLEERLLVLYQPVVDLRTGATVGCEALVRMRDYDGQVVDPEAFIPLAEASGAIHRIGEWVLLLACRQAAQWKQQLTPGAEFAVGVNLSPRQLDDPHLLGRVELALDESGLDPAALVLELTERLLTPDSPHVRAQLADIRSLGVHLAADDFGTGYCSVRYLADLPLDIVKIDCSWTNRFGEDSRSGRLADGVARLAASTGLVTIVEGVETEAQRVSALAHGLTLAQGFLFARPLSADDFASRLVLPRA